MAPKSNDTFHSDQISRKEKEIKNKGALKKNQCPSGQYSKVFESSIFQFILKSDQFLCFSSSEILLIELDLMLSRMNISRSEQKVRNAFSSHESRLSGKIKGDQGCVNL